MEGFSFNKIYVIESLDSDEKILSGTELYNDILRYSSYKDSSLSSELLIANTKQEFLEELIKIKNECTENGVMPIIHFEIHGEKDKRGLVTRSKELITWEELYPFLIQINVAIEHNLLITLAVCHGAYLLGINHITNRAPFWGFVGSFDEILAYDLLIRYNTFYDVLLTKFDITEAVVALHKANPELPSSYRFINSEELFKKLYELYIKTEFNGPAIETRWKRACEESKVNLRNRSEKKQFKKIFNKELMEDKEYRFKRDRRTFFMADLYQKNTRYLKDYSPFKKN